jgi:NTP pyrophosphatase (non-canonical NTP hydrolase)
MENQLELIRKERQRQNSKWGEQNHNVVEWIAILTEEVGEAAKEAVDFHFAYGDISNLPAGKNLQQERINSLKKELIQVAAVAVSILECIDRNNY